MRRTLALLLLACLSATAPVVHAAVLAVGREAQTDVMVTVYNGNLGLVRDVRTAALRAGVHEIQFADVASLIDPTSVHLASLTHPAGLRILDLTNIATPSAMTEVGFFDVDPASNAAGFAGAWHVYPFYPSGNVAIFSIQRGLFVVRPNL